MSLEFGEQLYGSITLYHTEIMILRDLRLLLIYLRTSLTSAFKDGWPCWKVPLRIHEVATISGPVKLNFTNRKSN